jgi:dGTPase
MRRSYRRWRDPLVRFDRRYPDKVPDNRSPAERDRDRILYTSAYRRLAGVTQVVSASEGHVFHNRLTHTIKVAQVARRLAEKLQRDGAALREAQPSLPEVPLDADVAEAAAHAHDLGHPPFGHVAEVELQRLMHDYDPLSSFEGNAQSFRIVTKVARAHLDYSGLNLTRATLNAILKYPWLHDSVGVKAEKKWGAYEPEWDDFAFAREGAPGEGLARPTTEAEQSLEAQIMDWADDITYAVHDVEDLYRAGLIPADRFASDPEARAEFAEWVDERWRRGNKIVAREEITRALEVFPTMLGVSNPYEGSSAQRIHLRMFTSNLIGRFVKATQIVWDEADSAQKWRLEIPTKRRIEADVMKELVWRFVILRPALASQQEGQKEVLRSLFAIFMDASDRANRDKDVNLLPTRLAEDVTRLRTADQDTPGARARVICDAFCSMTEDEVLQLYRRLKGVSMGSVLDAMA